MATFGPNLGDNHLAIHKTLAIALCLDLSGCAAQIAYSSASTVSMITTSKSLPELATSKITGADCSVYNWLFDNKDYLCEVRDPAKTYTRSGI